ncbi:major histocompatibility complex class I-related gene protein-like [Elgaria multicarinata webbii]|uniref:major histocompatibility complex class I-related gene protein-like n=1 Tax=Elgaria multicarinata webbii TaxID=159646 RepID=UPI002FCD1FDC
MGPLRWRTLILGVAAFMLGSCSSSSSLFFRTMYTTVSQPGQGLHHFTAVAYADDQPIGRYDSHTRRLLPQISWMKKVEEEDPEYCDRYTQMARNDEKDFRGDLVYLRNRYNQSKGFHTLQMMIVCEVRPDGSKGGHWQYGYDGRDFLSFDMETFSWTAADVEAQQTKSRWEAETIIVQRFQFYMEKTCAEWMQKDQDYGTERLLRKGPPAVRVTCKVHYDGMETLVCRAHGFYPREIDAVWMKDGEVWVEDTFRGVVAPNSDGTYYTWLGVKIDPKDRGRYRCHVEHDGLLEPLDLAWEEPTGLASNMVLVTACVVGAVLLGALLAGIWFYRKCQDGYKAASA